MPDEHVDVLTHQSGVNAKGEPFVQLVLRGEIIAQMTPADARAHARAITEAAEAAETDAFLMDWAQRVVGAPAAKAAALLLEFRQYRESRGKTAGPSSDLQKFQHPDNPYRKGGA